MKPLLHQPNTAVCPYKLGSLLLAFSAAAQAAPGKTANGCSYSVVNGKYISTCEPSASQISSDPNNSAQGGEKVKTPLTSYGEVPMAAPVASEANQVPTLRIKQKTPNYSQSAPTPVLHSASAVEKTESGISDERTPAASFVGLTGGIAKPNESKISAAETYGIIAGMDLDPIWSFELGYSYFSTNASIGLSERQGLTSLLGSEDTQYTKHSFSGVGRFYLATPSYRLRPFLEAGLGFSQSELLDNRGTGPIASRTFANQLSQNQWDALAAVGISFNLRKRISLQAKARLWVPIFFSEPELESRAGTEPNRTNGALAESDSPLLRNGVAQGTLAILYTF